MDHLFNTFMHSIAWHAGTNFAHMFGLPLVGIFVVYGCYKYFKKHGKGRN